MINCWIFLDFSLWILLWSTDPRTSSNWYASLTTLFICRLITFCVRFCHSCLAFFYDSNINFCYVVWIVSLRLSRQRFSFLGLSLSLSSVKINCRPECASVYHSCPINRIMLFICEMFRDLYLVLNGYLVFLCIHSMTTTFRLLIFYFFFFFCSFLSI